MEGYLLISESTELAVWLRPQTRERVTVVHSLAEARLAIRHSLFRGVLVDLDCTGTDRSRLEKLLEDKGATATVVLVSRDDLHHAPWCLSRGAHEVLVKSDCLLDELALRLHVASRRAESARELSCLRRELTQGIQPYRI